MTAPPPLPAPGPDAWYLAIDLGTGGTKIAAVTLDGEVLTTRFSNTDTTLLPNGGAVQDPGTWWSDVVDAVRALLASGTVDATRCAAVGITGQWGSTVPVGPDGCTPAPA